MHRDSGNVRATETFLYTSADLHLDTMMSQRSTENPLNFMAWFVFSHAFYVDRCVSFQIMSN